MAATTIEGRAGRVECSTRRRADGLGVRVVGTSARGRVVHDVAFRLTAAPGERTQLAIVLPPRGRLIDISGQPGAIGSGAERAVSVLEPERREEAMADIGAFLHEHLGDLTARLGLRAVRDPGAVGVEGVLGALGFPMIRAAIDAGAAGVGALPRWALEPLSASSARAATMLAVGRGRVTRRLVAALASSLVPRPLPPDALVAPVDPGVGDQAWFGTDPTRRAVACYPLALALMARDVLDPDRLSAVLEGAALWHGPGLWPRVDDLELAARWLPVWGTIRTARVLRDAVGRPDGPLLLGDTVLLQQATHNAGLLPGELGRLPNRLADLHEHLLARLPVDPMVGASDDGLALLGGTLAPRPVPARPARRRVPRARVDAVVAVPRRPLDRAEPEPPRPAVGVPARGLPAPPEQVRALPADTPLRFPAEIRELHGLSAGGLTLVVPRTVRELRHWGMHVHNCIGLYAERAASGLTWLVGVERAGELHYTVEIHPDRWVRQFVGPRNTLPDAVEARAVLALLVDRQVIPARAAAVPHR